VLAEKATDRETEKPEHNNGEKLFLLAAHDITGIEK